VSGSDPFLTTRWSLVLAAGGEGEPAREALGSLVSDAWYPLYLYVRRRGHDAHATEDLVQGFFASLLARRDLEGLDPAKGRFRAFLLAALSNHLAGERARERALKRGGGRVSLGIDFAQADARFLAEPHSAETPERAFERAWATDLLARTLAALRDEWTRDGKGVLFDALRPQLERADDATPYRELARELGSTEGALKVSVHRLRKRWRERLLAEIAGTLADPADIEDELAALFDATGAS